MKVQLYFRGITEIVGSEEMGLIVLTDEHMTRQLVIVCDKQTIYQFGLRMSRSAGDTSGLLPEVLARIIMRDTTLNYHIDIEDIDNGRYKTVVHEVVLGHKEAMRASDAILLAYICKLEIFIEEHLYLNQSVPYTANAKGMSIPINAISDDMLQKALDRAVKDENYELASQISNEQKKRKNKDFQGQ